MTHEEAIRRADQRMKNDIPMETKKRWLDGLQAAVNAGRFTNPRRRWRSLPRHALRSGGQQSEPLQHLGRDLPLQSHQLYRKGAVSVKSVLISIRPMWAYLICIGSKTVEIRKTAPKIKPPFKCFIYCTKPEEKYGDVIQTGKAHYYGGGKVVGEFVCDAVERLDMDSVGLIIDRTKEYTDWNPCMTRGEFLKYTGGMKPCGLHISDLKVYDKPKPLSEFKRWCGDGKWATLERMKRAPQSWCYVDGGLIG